MLYLVKRSIASNMHRVGIGSRRMVFIVRLNGHAWIRMHYKGFLDSGPSQGEYVKDYDD